jgi:hypothetical protein
VFKIAISTEVPAFGLTVCVLISINQKCILEEILNELATDFVGGINEILLAKLGFSGPG